MARPKNRGGNKFFEEDLPVIGTRAARVQYFVRDGRRVVVHESEKRQMDSRWTYIPMSASSEEWEHCARCAAELYSLGKPA